MKAVIQNKKIKQNKKSTNIENPTAYLSKHPVWMFHKCDLDFEKWSIRNPNSFDKILSKLIAYENMTWNEIQSASGGKAPGNGTNNHFENITQMSKEAQKRAEDIHLTEDQLFSLRLSGKERLYGILDNGIFLIIWYDSEHEVYPSKTK